MSSDPLGEPAGNDYEPLSSVTETSIHYPPIPSEEELEIYRGRKAIRVPPRADVNLDVPYLHQLWDTPTEFNGHWACGPTCALMVVAYYALLEPKPINLPKPYPHTSDFGWYISNVFEQNGHKFDETAKTKTGEAAGVYGSVVDALDSAGRYWGTHWHNQRGRGLGPLMSIFLKETDNRAKFLARPKESGSSRYMEREAAEQAMKACLDAGHPVIVSGFFQDKYDHLIVVRGYYLDPEDNQLKWIVNDPYGFETTGQGFDGGNVVYMFDEIKPKWMVLFSGSHTPAQRAQEEGHMPVRLFDKDSNQQIGEGTLIEGTDKVYIKRLNQVIGQGNE